MAHACIVQPIVPAAGNSVVSFHPLRTCIYGLEAVTYEEDTYRLHHQSQMLNRVSSLSQARPAYLLSHRQLVSLTIRYPRKLKDRRGLPYKC